MLRFFFFLFERSNPINYFTDLLEGVIDIIYRNIAGDKFSNYWHLYLKYILHIEFTVYKKLLTSIGIVFGDHRYCQCLRLHVMLFMYF